MWKQAKPQKSHETRKQPRNRNDKRNKSTPAAALGRRGAVAGWLIASGGLRRVRWEIQNFDDHLQASPAVSGDGTDKVKQARPVQRENRVAVVGEERRVRRLAPLVLRFRHHH